MQAWDGDSMGMLDPGLGMAQQLLAQLREWSLPSLETLPLCLSFGGHRRIQP